MITTDYSWKFDYEISPEEQEWHELFIRDFEYKLEQELKRHFNNTMLFHFNFFYYPKIRKFYITNISPREEIVIKTLKDVNSFWKLYFLDQLYN